jgi:histone-lysine N-methyltransferase SETMAR
MLIFPHDVTINAQYYSNLLYNDVHQAIRKKRPGNPSKKINRLHDDARPQTANFTKATLAAMGWETMNHLPYTPDLAPCYFHLFGPITVHLGGQKFQTDDELKCSVLNLLCSQDKIFTLLASVTCQEDRKMYECKWRIS